jgi:predicted DNA-binding protein
MKDKKITIRITDEQRKKLQVFAIENNTSVQEILEKHIEEITRKGELQG